MMITQMIAAKLIVMVILVMMILYLMVKEVILSLVIDDGDVNDADSFSDMNEDSNGLTSDEECDDEPEIMSIDTEDVSYSLVQFLVKAFFRIVHHHQISYAAASKLLALIYFAISKLICSK